MNRRPTFAALLSALVIVAVGVLWVLFAPTKLGGQASYVIVNGNSMEPGMHRGDLAIVRRSHAYAEGDIVTYRHPEIGPVIHRIIGREGDRYAFQGDNNSWIDSYKPTRKELIGELWIHVPNAGGWLVPLQERRNAAIVIVVAFFGLGGGFEGTRRLNKSGKNRPAALASAAQSGRTAMPSTRTWEDALVIFAVATAALATLAFVAFRAGVSREVPDDAPYTQSGRFAYEATAADGSVYDTGGAVTGDPLFRRLSDSAAFRFDYTVSSAETVSARGTARLFAEVSDRSGWKRTIELQPLASFEGSTISASGTLVLPEVQAIIDNLESQTGVENREYTLAIVPEVAVEGTVGGRPFRDTMAPRLQFTLNNLSASLNRPETEDSDPLAPAAEGLAKGTRFEPNTIDILMVSLPVTAARTVSLAGFGALFAISGAVLVYALHRQRASRVDLAFDLTSRYGSTLISVVSPPAGRTTTIDVASVDDLARLADRDNGVVLQEVRPGYHAFFVRQGNVVYRFIAEGRPTGRKESAA